MAAYRCHHVSVRSGQQARGIVQSGFSLLEAIVAMVLISVSFFAASVWGVNYYTLPVDVYGQGRTGFAVSYLTASFGVFVLVVSPMIGAIAKRQGFAVVCYAFAFFPLIGYGAMEVGRRFRAAAA